MWLSRNSDRWRALGLSFGLRSRDWQAGASCQKLGWIDCLNYKRRGTLGPTPCLHAPFFDPGGGADLDANQPPPPSGGAPGPTHRRWPPRLFQYPVWSRTCMLSRCTMPPAGPFMKGGGVVIQMAKRTLHYTEPSTPTWNGAGRLLCRQPPPCGPPWDPYWPPSCLIKEGQLDDSPHLITWPHLQASACRDPHRPTLWAKRLIRTSNYRAKFGCMIPRTKLKQKVPKQRWGPRGGDLGTFRFLDQSVHQKISCFPLSNYLLWTQTNFTHKTTQWRKLFVSEIHLLSWTKFWLEL